MPDIDDLDWQAGALCAQADPEAWFPEKGSNATAAKRICFTCPIRTECLQYALDNDIRHGVWGGLSESERELIDTNRIAKKDEDLAARNQRIFAAWKRGDNCVELGRRFDLNATYVNKIVSDLRAGEAA